MKSLLVIIAVIIGLSLFSSSSDSSGDSYNSESYDGYSIEEEPVEEEITSDNWDCTSDCSGHDAGYEWASDNGITDPYDCDGNSNSFIEGCEAYANESQMEYEEEYDEEYYDY